MRCNFCFGAGNRCIPVSLFLAILFGSTLQLQAQVESDERPLLVSQNGLAFRKDSVFLMNMRFRMQNRFGYYSTMDAKDEAGFEAQVRRLRLRFDGFVISRKVGYYIQLSFSRSDQELTSGTIAQTVRDAMVYYTFNKNFYIGFGQSKLPGNRERVTSSGNLQMPDRSVANGVYTLDRDFGTFAYWTLPLKGKQQIQLKGAISTGEGRGQLVSNTGLAYTGRVEWLPMGAFANLGDYSEGDQEFEAKPKLSLGLTYSYNDRAVRTNGQLGSTLPKSANMGTIIADYMFKYNGWGSLGEFFKKDVDGYELDGTNDFAMQRIPRGTGFNFHVSRMLGRRHELVGRYAGVTPEKGFENYQYRYRQKGLGYNYYLNKHRVKFQYYMGLDDRQHPGVQSQLLHNYKNRFVSMIQVELGI